MAKPVRKALPEIETTESEDSRKVVLADVRSVDYLEIPLQPGRITVLTGDNGVGKTTALEAVDALAGQKTAGGLSSRDGTVGGTVEGFGAQIRIARNGSNRRTGKPVVTSLHDQIGIAKFVDPGVADPDAADFRRIQQLARFMRVDVSRQAVAAKLGIEVDDLDSFIDPEVWKNTDPVELIQTIKREIQKQARALESDADKIQGELRIIEQRIVEIGPPVSAAEMQAIRDRQASAVQQLAELRKIRESYSTLQMGWDAAEATLERFSGVDWSPNSIADQLAALDAAQVERGKQIDELNRQIEKLIAERDAGMELRDQLNQRLGEAGQRDAKIAEANQVLKTRVPCPTAEEIQEAESAVNAANLDAEKLSQQEVAKSLRASRDQKIRSVEQSLKSAESMRERAGSIVEILAQGINEAKTPIVIGKDMRVRRKGHKRGEVFYSELSHGERLRDFLKLILSLIEVESDEVIVTIPQENWESLSAKSRQEVAEIVAETGVMMLTAEASREGDPLEVSAKIL